jgi:uncharacterized iron-regulated membrane protein
MAGLRLEAGVKHYWLVALLALGAFVALALIVYTWPQRRPLEAETRPVAAARTSPQLVSAETLSSSAAWTNEASLGIARKLRLIPYASSWSVEPT